MHKHPLKNVIDNGYCIGCGACAVKSDSIEIKENTFGLYQASLDDTSDIDTGIEAVCPFVSEIDEDEISKKLYEEDASFDKTVGYYQKVYTGYATDSHVRGNSSSGGLVTWVLSELLKTGEIDGVIHIGEQSVQGELFAYRISETIEEIQANAKSRYYPVHFDDVIKQVMNSDKKYAFVGVPCFIKAVRLLALSDPTIQKNIVFCVSLFCGHFKTKAFSEMIAWQQGVPPEKMASINFRVKNNKASHNYSAQVGYEDKIGLISPLPPVQIKELYGMDWGLGLFKPKACDWCDDIAGETADITLGDAWLPEYSQDSGGRNIVVVRNNKIAKILEEGLKNKQVSLIEESVEKVYESQAGNYRHRQEGLSVRIEQAEKEKQWYPIKRIKQHSFSVPEERKKLYLHRVRVSEKSHLYFRQAKLKNSFIIFLIKILPLQIKYYILNKRISKHVLIYGYQLLRYFLRKKI